MQPGPNAAQAKDLAYHANDESQPDQEHEEWGVVQHCGAPVCTALDMLCVCHPKTGVRVSSIIGSCAFLGVWMEAMYFPAGLSTSYAAGVAVTRGRRNVHLDGLVHWPAGSDTGAWREGGCIMSRALPTRLVNAFRWQGRGHPHLAQ